MQFYCSIVHKAYNRYGSKRNEKEPCVLKYEQKDCTFQVKIVSSLALRVHSSGL